MSRFLSLLILGLLVLPVQAAPGFNSEEQTNIRVYQEASPAVVTVGSGDRTGAGSFVTAEGLVLTNEHVVRTARRGAVQIKTSQGKTYTGTVIATDVKNDLALIRINTKDRFPTVPLAKTSGIQVGQQVFAIGNPFGLSGTLTTGILSRVAPNGDLQTDAALNPGNSGGPLLNSKGELIGVNKAILSTGGGNVGIGFATSAPVAQKFIQQNRNNTLVAAAAPRLGVSLDTGTLTINQVQAGSVAAELGLRPGDRLLAINGKRLTNAAQLRAFLDTRPPSATFTVARNQLLAEIYVDF